MQVRDILRVKGNTLFTAQPGQSLMDAVSFMADKDLGSLVVMDKGQVMGMLTFREVIQKIVGNAGQVGASTVNDAMDRQLLTCSPDTAIDEVRRMMLERHARYMPVVDGSMLMGVISFYDVAKAVVEAQDFENKMLKAYIRDWPDNQDAGSKTVP